MTARHVEIKDKWNIPGYRAREDIKWLADEVERLRNALHRISLCSQNSMSSKEECGRIAREALAEEKR